MGLLAVNYGSCVFTGAHDNIKLVFAVPHTTWASIACYYEGPIGQNTETATLIRKLNKKD
jgi:hypothetical protein